LDRVILIYNPKSGNQKFELKLDFVMKLLHNKYDDILVLKTKYAGQATEFAKLACQEKYDLMIIVGGDGTFNECVNGLMIYNERPRIGYIPTGTCCDIGMSMGITKNIAKATYNIINNCSAKMDVVKSNNRYFCYVSGNGAFVDISYVTNSKLKKSSFSPPTTE